MKRSPPSSRKAPLRNSEPRRNSSLRSSGKPGRKPRKASEFARVYGSKQRVAWIAARPSVVSGMTPCENCHTQNGGTSRKADARWIVPLTREEHAELHRVGKRTFEQRHGVDLDMRAEVIQAEWELLEFALSRAQENRYIEL